MTERSIKSVPEFLEAVFELMPEGGLRCFRGEANSEWELKPSVMRNLRADAEANIIRELTLEAPAEFNNDKSMFHKLVRAQHYGLPTRLLDVSLNPLVGLFFACADDDQADAQGSVLVLDFRDIRVKYADSDTVSVLSNLARLDDIERNKILTNLNKIGRKEKNWGVENQEIFRSSKEIFRLVQFIRDEKPYFQNTIKPMDLIKYYFVHPAKTNSRVIAQSGAFVIAGLLKYKNTEKAYSFKLNRINIESNNKKKILNELDKININHRTMFPEIEFTSRYIKQKWKK